MKMNNRRNLLIYRLWAPIYDRVAGRFMRPGRTRAMEVLNLRPGDRVLLVGVGTGADLPLLPPGVSAVGVDLSIHMLAKARRKLPIVDRDVHLVQGDAQELMVEEGGFRCCDLQPHPERHSRRKDLLERKSASFEAERPRCCV
ncbi:MAG: methyltransferase domain-containing protein [Opitutales bacterium]|nr:methyltransferase domain-containing protein [Opitutales bacterium]